MDPAFGQDRNWRNLPARLGGEGKVPEVPGLLRRLRITYEDDITGKGSKRSLDYQ